jgi:hypothetical protein
LDAIGTSHIFLDEASSISIICPLNNNIINKSEIQVKNNNFIARNFKKNKNNGLLHNFSSEYANIFIVSFYKRVVLAEIRISTDKVKLRWFKEITIKDEKHT